MIITIVIFFIAIVTAFGMLSMRAWEIRTNRITPEIVEHPMPELSFRHLEKNMLYLTKHIIQSIILVCAKYWFILTTRTKKWISTKWPKIHDRFIKKPESSETVSPSFVQRAVLESKAKIKRIREKVKKEHGEDSEPPKEPPQIRSI